jgi:transcription antitermination factor NusG
MPTPRFQVGDRVRVIRAGPNNSLVGIVREIDTAKVAVHYLVEFNNVHKQRFPEFDLDAAPFPEKRRVV